MNKKIYSILVLFICSYLFVGKSLYAKTITDDHNHINRENRIVDQSINTSLKELGFSKDIIKQNLQNSIDIDDDDGGMGVILGMLGIKGDDPFIKGIQKSMNGDPKNTFKIMMDTVNQNLEQALPINNMNSKSLDTNSRNAMIGIDQISRHIGDID